MNNTNNISDWNEEDGCPCCGAAIKKVYTYGSTMSAETEVFTFTCGKHFVSSRHDPVGQYPATVRLHHSFGEAAGTGKFHAAVCADKYR